MGRADAYVDRVYVYLFSIHRLQGHRGELTLSDTWHFVGCGPGGGIVDGYRHDVCADPYLTSLLLASPNLAPDCYPEDVSLPSLEGTDTGDTVDTDQIRETWMRIHLPIQKRDACNTQCSLDAEGTDAAMWLAMEARVEKRNHGAGA